jgi:hypothetical protein
VAITSVGLEDEERSLVRPRVTSGRRGDSIGGPLCQALAGLHAGRLSDECLRQPHVLATERVVVTGTVGRRAWTVPMIWALSMPCR